MLSRSQYTTQCHDTQLSLYQSCVLISTPGGLSCVLYDLFLYFCVLVPVWCKSLVRSSTKYRSSGVWQPKRGVTCTTVHLSMENISAERTIKRFPALFCRLPKMKSTVTFTEMMLECGIQASCVIPLNPIHPEDTSWKIVSSAFSHQFTLIDHYQLLFLVFYVLQQWIRSWEANIKVTSDNKSSRLWPRVNL